MKRTVLRQQDVWALIGARSGDLPTCAVIGEAMVATVLADAMLEKFGGDHIEETIRNWRAYMAGLGPKVE